MYPAVHKFQDGLQITPLSGRGRDVPRAVGTVDPSVDMKTPPSKQVAAMPAKDFFEYGAQLMKLHPPTGIKLRLFAYSN